MAGGLLEGQAAAAILRAGGVLLLETDTLPGLHARADREDATARIAALKGHPAGRPLLVLAAGWEDAARLTLTLDRPQEEFCRRCWPGPFSLILPARPGLPRVVAPQGTVAIRVPAPAALRDLIRAAGFPLVSTSANLTGRPPCRDLAAARTAFGALVDGAWGWSRAPGDPAAVAGVPSALIDVTCWPPVVRRSGPLPPPGWQAGADQAPDTLDGPPGGV